eukprot:12488431-Prorocentrum_lima.AAC.1
MHVWLYGRPPLLTRSEEHGLSRDVTTGSSSEFVKPVSGMTRRCPSPKTPAKAILLPRILRANLRGSHLISKTGPKWWPSRREPREARSRASLCSNR